MESGNSCQFLQANSAKKTLATDQSSSVTTPPCSRTTPASSFNSGKKSPTTLGAALSPRSLTIDDLKTLFQNGFLTYLAFLMLGSVLYHSLGGSFYDMSIRDGLGYVSTVMEAFGLLILQWKIKQQQSVAGISGKCVAMFGLCYAFRAIEIPPFSAEFLDPWTVKVLEQASFVLVAQVLYSVFVTYKSTYQADLDNGLRIGYIVVACILLSLAVHPDDESIPWTAFMYMDTLALMPQVVMMSRGSDGLVEAPISHFVFATAASRGIDLYYWCWSAHELGMDYNAWVTVSVHVIYQLLVADFVYLYLKQRLSSRSLSQPMELKELEEMV